MQYNFNYKLFQRVEPNTTFEQEMAPCENCTMEIAIMSGSAPYLSECHVEIVFGDEIIFSTHGDKTDSSGIILSGNDGKNLKFRLINNSTKDETMGLTMAGNKSE